MVTVSLTENDSLGDDDIKPSAINSSDTVDNLNFVLKNFYWILSRNQFFVLIAKQSSFWWYN